MRHILKITVLYAKILLSYSSEKHYKRYYINTYTVAKLTRGWSNTVIYREYKL